MTKLKKFLISGLAVCAIGCTAAGLAACNNSADYPNYRKPANYIEPGDITDTEFRGDYTVAVMTAGGMRINGVKAEIKLNGETVLTGISMDNGEITFRANPAEYEIVVDESTLPTGYFVGEEKYKTSATSGNASVIVNSKVMTTTAVSSHRYALGDVMYDFSYTDNNGERHILSELLAEDSQYKAVFLNFWYIGCGPCRDEFPAIQAAYENYKDKIKFIAVSTEDSQTAINNFRNENRYTFDMVQDYSGLSSLFSIASTPATVVIDRYGVYVNYEVGKQVDSRIWSSKFAHYVSDDYVQTPSSSTDNPGNGDTGDVTERIEPNIPEDDYTKFPAILNGSGANGKVIEYYGATTENDKKYNWPWVIEQGGGPNRPYVKTTNSTYGNSFSIMTATISLEAGDYLSYDYFTSTEAGQDILYVLIDGKVVAQHSGETSDGLDPAANGWATQRAVYTASRNRTIELAFCYMKDQMENSGEDYVAISNITIENVRDAVDAIDMKTDACSGEIMGGKYTQYVQPYFNEDDKYYHVKYGDNKDSILFLDYTNPTAWSDLHLNSTTFKPNDPDIPQQDASLYFMLYWDHTNWKTKGEDESLKLTIGGSKADKLTETFINSYYTSIFSENLMIPVTEDIKDLIDAFIDGCKTVPGIKNHKNMWLEFCYYFMHFGSDHEFIDHDLYKYEVPVAYDKDYDVYRVTADNGNLDDKVYIDFIRTNAFGITDKEGVTTYYSIDDCIREKLFDKLGATDYATKITAYLNKAKQNTGELYGLIEANDELVKILQAFVEAYGVTDKNGWQMFACYYNVGDCNATADPIIGMNFINAYTAKLGENSIDVWNTHTIDGGGMVAKFVPDKNGVYKFASYDLNMGDDPKLILYDKNYKQLTSFDNLVRYDLFLQPNTDAFEGYHYLKAGETYYMRISKGYQTEGIVNYRIDYVGETYDELRVASTGDGMWTFDLNLGINFAYYLAIDVDMYSNNIYYHIDENGERGSVVYIDFIHPNFYDVNDNSLFKMIEGGLFDFAQYGGGDYTATMREYYYKAISKDEDTDETYGMTEATKELVSILTLFIELRNGEKPETKYWLAFATYYEYYGANL